MVYDDWERNSMNKKGLAPIIILLILVVAGAAAGGVWLQSKRIGKKEPPAPKTNQEPADSEAVSVVKTFCDNFFKGPPALNEQGVVIALGLLSQKAKQSMTVTGPSPSAVLASFAGVVDVPNQGYTIDEISEGAETATIKTTWKYSSGPVTKTFELGKENGIFKIDSIR